MRCNAIRCLESRRFMHHRLRGLRQFHARNIRVHLSLSFSLSVCVTLTSSHCALREEREYFRNFNRKLKFVFEDPACLKPMKRATRYFDQIVSAYPLSRYSHSCVSRILLRSQRTTRTRRQSDFLNRNETRTDSLLVQVELYESNERSVESAMRLNVAGFCQNASGYYVAQTYGQ